MAVSRTAAALVATVVAAAVAGCGGSDGGDAGTSIADKSADEIRQAAVEDMRTLDSLTIDGEIDSDGRQLGLHVSVTTRGDCEGEITLEKATAEFRKVGDRSFLKADEDFWSQSAGDDSGSVMGALIGDRWVSMGEDDSGFDDFCDLDDLLDELESDEGDEVTKGDIQDVDGREAVALEVEDDDRRTVWVATTGRHHILRMELAGEDNGTLDLSGFDQEVEVEEPSEDDVVDLSDLGG